MITGMHGNKCREKVTTALESVTGVNDVDVNLYRAQAIVTHATRCAAAELVQAVAACGYAAELVGSPGEDPDKRHGEGT
jgi:copper chaperone CopZ